MLILFILLGKNKKQKLDQGLINRKNNLKTQSSQICKKRICQKILVILHEKVEYSLMHLKLSKMRMPSTVGCQNLAGILIVAALLETTLGTMYRAIPVDTTYEIIQSFSVWSLVHCVASCEIQDGCSVVAYNKVSNSCNSLKRGSVSWTTPSKTVYVSPEGKYCTFPACYFWKDP